MAIVGIDHLVVNARDAERAIAFYRDVLGMEIPRLDEFREGKVGFASARVSSETIIDIRPSQGEEAVTPNVDHYCLVLGPTDMEELHADLKAKGIKVAARLERTRADRTGRQHLTTDVFAAAWVQVATSTIRQTAWLRRLARTGMQYRARGARRAERYVEAGPIGEVAAGVLLRLLPAPAREERSFGDVGTRDAGEGLSYRHAVHEDDTLA